MTRTKIALALSIATLLSGAAFADTVAEKDQQRDVNQQQRIENGLQSGQLNTKEAGRLEREQQHVDRLEAHDMKDGHMSANDKAYPVQLMGVHGQSIIVTAPLQADGSLVPVLTGQTLACRTFQLTSAFRFTAVAMKAAFEPFPHLYLQIKKVARHQIRGAPRARVSVRAELQTSEALPCVLCDLSTGGARIAVDIATFALEKGKKAQLRATLELLQSKFHLEVPVTVLNSLGPTDSRHPNVTFYGVKFDTVSERDGLILYGYVGEHLLSELHGLWQMLVAASGTGT